MFTNCYTWLQNYYNLLLHTYMYIYIYIYISATVPPGTPERVRVVVWCLIVRFLTFKGVQGLLLAFPFFIIFRVSFFDAFLEPNGLPQGAQNRSKSQKIVFQRPPWEHPQKSHQKWCILGTLPTSKYRVSCNRGIKIQEIAGLQKWPQNDLQMPPILDASGTILDKKCLPEGYQKMH